MPTNKQIAEIFAKTADLLEIKGENPFKVRAYRNAARLIENSSKDFNKLVKENFDLTKLPGIGKDLSEYIKEIVTTGKFHKLQELQKEIPSGLSDLLSIEGLGPKRVKLLYETYGIKNMQDLKKLAQNGGLLKLPGFGPKLVEKILRGFRQLKKAGIRFLWADVEDVAYELKNYLQNFEGVEVVEIAGSFRRKKESVGDLDILVIAENYPKVSEYFVKFDKVAEIYSKGLTRSTVFLNNGLQVDLRAVAKENYAAALHYFTGSKSHNIEIRKLAMEKGLKINEYGVYKKDKKLPILTEADIYESVGLVYIEPELRENRGEIEAARENKLPKLITPDDIKGDMISVDSFEELERNIKIAIEQKYSHLIVVSNNSKIISYSKNFDSIRIITAEPAYILKNGDIDYNKNSEADFYVGMLTNEKLSSEKQTLRYIKALKQGIIKIMLRPSLREIFKYQIEAQWDEIFKVASKSDVIFEINANPLYADLNDLLIKEAKKYGVKFYINSDLKFMKYGINQARRGWCEKNDIVNSYERIEYFS